MTEAIINYSLLLLCDLMQADLVLLLFFLNKFTFMCIIRYACSILTLSMTFAQRVIKLKKKKKYINKL